MKILMVKLMPTDKNQIEEKLEVWDAKINIFQPALIIVLQLSNKI